MNFGWRISPSTVPWRSYMIFGRNIDTLLALHLQLLARFGALRCGAANPMDLGVSCVGSALRSIGCGVREDAAPLRSIDTTSLTRFRDSMPSRRATARRLGLVLMGSV